MRSLAAGAVALLFSTLAHADDWPQWRGPMRTGHVSSNALIPTTLAAEPAVIWRRKVGDGLASPIVAGSNVFYLDHQSGREIVHALSAATGDAVWQADLDRSFKDSQSPAGPRATPVADGDFLYVQSCRGELKCLSSIDGHVLWRTNYVTDFGAVFSGEQGKAAGASRHGYNASPIVHGNLLIALVGSADNAGVVAFEKHSGAVQWRGTSEAAAYSSPIVARLAGREQVIAFMADALIGVDLSNGALLWRLPLKTTFARHVATPVVANDHVLVSSHEFGLLGVKVAADGPQFTAAVAWTNKEAAFNFASPILVDNHLYALGPRKNLVCVNPRDGALAWSQDNFVPTSADKAHVAFIGMSDKLLALTDSGELRWLAANPVEFKELGRAQVCGANWCSPAYAGGHLYLRDGKELLKVKLVP